MDTTDSSNIGLERGKSLARLIQGFFKAEPKSEFAQFEINKLKKDLGIADFDLLRRTLDRLQEDLKPDFEYTFIKRSAIGSVADHENRKPSFVVEGVKIIIDDRERLNGYLSMQKESKGIYFDSVKSRLHVRNKEISIRKFSDQYHVLRIIFDNPQKEVQKEWFFSELVEKLDEYKKEEKTYYNAVHQVRLKLESSGYPEFFITTRQSARINPIYLS